MNSDQRRNGRINTLYQKAITGKYNWKQLRQEARAMGVSETTVTSYLQDVKARLEKRGMLKNRA